MTKEGLEAFVAVSIVVVFCVNKGESRCEQNEFS